MKIRSNIKDYSIDFVSDKNIFDAVVDNENTFYVIDKKVYKIYQNEFLNNIPTKRLFLLNANEKNKNIKTAFSIIDQMIDIPGKRNARLVSIGGGITQDITGFIANILYRGIDWVFFPTTLLAAADSCMGSKTSLNYKTYKNILGTFYPPSKIIINSDFFRTLSKKDYLSGLGEVVKFNLMYGKIGLDRIEKDINLLLKRDEELIQKYNQYSLQFKKTFVEKDEFDIKERVMLNFAHTFGHAIETVTNYEIPHGTAVAMGMIIANRISFKRELLNDEYLQRSEAILNKIINVKDYTVSLSQIISSIKKDKKQINSNLRAILLDNKMNLNLVNDITEEEIKYGFSFTKVNIE